MLGIDRSELERELFAELFAQDPFEVTGPVSDDANFFGRRDEAQELARKLQHGYILKHDSEWKPVVVKIGRAHV